MSPWLLGLHHPPSGAAVLLPRPFSFGDQGTFCEDKTPGALVGQVELRGCSQGSCKGTGRSLTLGALRSRLGQELGTLCWGGGGQTKRARLGSVILIHIFP